MNIPEDLKYSKDHEWLKMDGDTAVVGITDYAQDSLGDVVFIELPAAGDEVEAGDSVGVVESVKSVSDIYTPVSGEITQVNESLEDEPESINKSPYEKGWIFKIKVSSDASGLMDSDAYSEYVG